MKIPSIDAKIMMMEAIEATGETIIIEYSIWHGLVRVTWQTTHMEE
jgi:hypothetical protein